MDISTLPRYSGSPHEEAPEHGPATDRHTWEFAIAAILGALAIFAVFLLVFMLLIMLCGGLAFGPVFA